MMKNKGLLGLTLLWDSIALDLIYEIFTRLAPKSLMRFRCISKLCASMIATRSFAKLLEIRAPRVTSGLLISCASKLQYSQLFFSTGLDGGPAVLRLAVPPRFSRFTSSSVKGIVCMDFGLCATLCNPSTRQAVTLPLIYPANSPLAASTFFCVNSFGFDPVTEQYKVLNSWVVPNLGNHKYQTKRVEYRVFVLGTNSWRRISGGLPYYPQREGVCVDGVIYFRSWIAPWNPTEPVVLVAFNLHTESFHEFPLPAGAPQTRDTSCLIEFAGYLGIVESGVGDKNRIGLWLFQHPSNKVWVKHMICLPSSFRKLGGNKNYNVVGVLHTGDILLAPHCVSNDFHVFSYDLEMHEVKKIDISGLAEHQPLDSFCNAVTVTKYEKNILSLA